MSRYTGSVCKLCRREGVKLFLKGARCYTEKCAVERRPYAPGQHGQSRGKFSEYGVQLREKQKVKRIYSLVERSFYLLFLAAQRKKGLVGDNLIRFLELRLDNVVYRLGFSSSRSQARQLVRGGYVLVNGRKVDIPSYLCKEGDEISLKEKARQFPFVLSSLDSRLSPLVGWLEFDSQLCKGVLKVFPARHELDLPVQEQFIVELYSK